MESNKKAIENSIMDNMPEIFRLYRLASEHQRAVKAVVVWPEFDKKMVENEILEKRQWKLIIDDKVACVWATTFSDEDIWEERNADNAIYIHRIATNPSFRGNNFVSVIVEWAKEYSKKNGIDFIRLDTVGNNLKLIEHYKNAGFNFLGFVNLKDTSKLPEHYHKLPACLFEMKL